MQSRKRGRREETLTEAQGSPCLRVSVRTLLRSSALVMVLLLCSCTQKRAAEITESSGAIIDAFGRSYVIKEYPDRIISLSPAITEILFAIGAGDKVVGVTQYCDYPPEAKTRTSIGGFTGATMSMEQIYVLEPDLVILSADMHARIVTLLDELGIPSFAVEPMNFSQVYDAIALVGEITGCGQGAEEVITEMKNTVARVGEKIRGQLRPGVFWVLSIDPLMSAGAETFISEAITLGGGKNIFDDVRERWPLVSPEQVLVRNPEWILIGDDMTGMVPLSNPFWQSIPAVREGRVAVIKADTLYRYGPRLVDGVDSIAKILHPDP